MSKEKLVVAREFIKEKKYKEARTILESIDHPTAKKWLAKLDIVAPEKKISLPVLGSLVITMILIGIVGIAILIFSILPRALNSHNPTSQLAQLPTSISLPTSTSTGTSTSTPQPSPTNTSTSTPQPSPTKVPTSTPRPNPTKDTSRQDMLVKNMATYCFPIMNLAAAGDAVAETDIVQQLHSVNLYDSAKVEDWCDEWATKIVRSEEKDTIEYCQSLADTQFRSQTFVECLTDRNFIGNYLFDANLLMIFEEGLSRQLFYDLVDDDIIRRYRLNS
jgi:cytoskeletal protein RodZ